MANLDSTDNVFLYNKTVVAWTDGTDSVTCILKQGALNYVSPGPSFVEVREAGKHLATPIVVETEDGDTTGSITMVITSFKGSSNDHPYEVATGAAGWTTTGKGNRKLLTMTVTMTGADAAAPVQILTFSHVALVLESVDMPTDGPITMTVNFTAHQNRPVPS